MGPGEFMGASPCDGVSVDWDHAPGMGKLSSVNVGPVTLGVALA